MDGLAELVTPAERTIQVGEHTLTVRPLRVRDWGQLEQRVVARRPNPLDIVLDSAGRCNTSQLNTLLEAAYRDRWKMARADENEVAEYVETTEGLAYQIWLMAGGQAAPVSEKAICEAVGGQGLIDNARLKRELAYLNWSVPGN